MTPENIDQIVAKTVAALTPIIKDAVASNKLDVGKKAKWADDAVEQTQLEQQRKILQQQSQILALLRDKGSK